MSLLLCMLFHTVPAIVHIKKLEFTYTHFSCRPISYLFLSFAFLFVGLFVSEATISICNFKVFDSKNLIEITYRLILFQKAISEIFRWSFLPALLGYDEFVIKLYEGLESVSILRRLC